jgi:hypothetical protein
MYDEALNGKAVRKGGNATPAEHNSGNTNSQYTSWTTNPEVATNYAIRPKGSGVVLKATVPSSRLTKSPSLKNITLKQIPGKIVNESEFLIRGTLRGCKVQALNN